jgi:DNA-binding IclR family transcriptional regulator
MDKTMVIENVGNGERDSIQVIARAAAVLRVVAANPDGLSLSEISRQTDLARSTIQRIVKSLEQQNFLESAAGHGYLLGGDLLALASRPARDVVSLAEPLLRDLAATVDETVDLSVLSGSSAVFVCHVAGSHRLAALSSVGTQFPLHSTANGKSMLACLGIKQREAFLKPGLTADTPQTVLDRAILLTQIADAALTGVAFDLEEHTEGVCAVGTAFLDASGLPYAISIPVPRQRFENKAKALEKPLLECRQKIVNAIGGTLPSS